MNQSGPLNKTERSQGTWYECGEVKMSTHRATVKVPDDNINITTLTIKPKKSKVLVSASNNRWQNKAQRCYQ